MAFFAEQLEDQHACRTGQNGRHEAERQAAEQHLDFQEGGKVHPGTEGKGKERNRQQLARLQEFAHLGIEVAQQHADADRQQYSDKRDEGEVRTHHAQRHQGEERTVIQRKDRNGADVRAIPVLGRKGGIHPAVSVGHRGDNRHRRQAEEAVHHVAGQLSPQKADDHAGKILGGSQQHAFFQRRSADPQIHLAAAAEQEQGDQNDGAVFKEGLGKSADAQKLVMAVFGRSNPKGFQKVHDNGYVHLVNGVQQGAEQQRNNH